MRLAQAPSTKGGAVGCAAGGRGQPAVSMAALRTIPAIASAEYVVQLSGDKAVRAPPGRVRWHRAASPVAVTRAQESDHMRTLSTRTRNCKPSEKGELRLGESSRALTAYALVKHGCGCGLRFPPGPCASSALSQRYCAHQSAVASTVVQPHSPVRSPHLRTAVSSAGTAHHV